MTRIFDDKGAVVPVTVVKAGPCYVVQVKNSATDGYAALQLGFQETAEKKLVKPLAGVFKKRKLPALRRLREHRIDQAETANYTVGQKLTVDQFKDGDYVDIVGTSIGKGFQGVVKRHGFRGGAGSHGSMSHRAPGSIGQTAPQRVTKGRRMAGHMGHTRITIMNLKIARVLPEKDVMLVRGAVPGPAQGYLFIRKAVKKTGAS